MAKNNIHLDFSYVPMTDEMIVRTLIENRIRFDPKCSDGGGTIGEDAICVYADLDSLIEQAKLSPSERQAVEYLMDGYSLTDLATDKGTSRQNCNGVYRRAISKIVGAAQLSWQSFYSSEVSK